MGNTLIHGMIDAIVGLATPIGKVRLILFYQLLAAIRTTTIDNNPLEIFTSLADDRVDGALEASLIIIVNCDDGQFHINFLKKSSA